MPINEYCKNVEEVRNAMAIIKPYLSDNDCSTLVKALAKALTDSLVQR